MIRATSFAFGLFVVLCGGVLLLIDQVILTPYATSRLTAWENDSSAHLSPVVESSETQPKPASAAGAIATTPAGGPPIRLATVLAATTPAVTGSPATAPPVMAPLADSATDTQLPSAWQFRSRLVTQSNVVADAPALLERELIDPPDWGAAGLLSLGGIVLLYAFCVPKSRHRDHSLPVFQQDSHIHRVAH